MANIRKDIQDYRKMASRLGLMFTMKVAPYRVRDSTTWECLNCHRIIHTSFANLSVADHGCICQIGATNGEDKYHELASRLSIQWIGRTLPRNVREMTRWYSKIEKKEFEASYADIGYSIIKSRFRKYVAEAVHE